MYVESDLWSHLVNEESIARGEIIGSYICIADNHMASYKCTHVMMEVTTISEVGLNSLVEMDEGQTAYNIASKEKVKV